MQQLAPPDIQRFKELYRARFGQELSVEEAREQGAKLLDLVALLIRSGTGEKHKRT